jgi:phage recombination protein Bet
MSTALAITTNNNIILWDDSTKLNEIRKLFAPKLTDMEFQFFVGMGKASNLNPFTREIWAVKYQDSAPAQVFIGRDGYRKAAQRHPDYDYHQCDAVYENDTFKIFKGEVEHNYTLVNRGKLVGASCSVKRKASEKPMYVFVELSEYSTGKSLWHPQTGKPATMIKKVAEAQCLRACFQDLLGGTYGEEEFSRGQPLRVVNSSTQTERLKTMLNVNESTGELIENEPLSVHNTGSDELPISDEQIEEIQDLIFSNGLSDEQVTKSLSRYNVKTISELSDAQAKIILLKLRGND